DPLGAAALRGETDRSYILKDVNDEWLQTWYSSLSRGWSWRWWSAENTLTATYSLGRNDRFGLVAAGSPKVYWYAYTSQRFQLPKAWQAELIAWWRSELNDGTVRRASAGALTLAVSRPFFQDRLRVRLLANDIFHTVRADGDYSVAETDITFFNKWNSNYFRLSISVNLGQLKDNAFQNRKTGQDAINRG
ncbi:MAG: outer membrane beta-barrel protein, partial [Bacteroidota bacterium]